MQAITDLASLGPLLPEASHLLLWGSRLLGSMPQKVRDAVG